MSRQEIPDRFCRGTTLIPDNERWLHEPEVKAKLDRALAWAAENPPRETDLEELEKKILGGR